MEKLWGMFLGGFWLWYCLFTWQWDLFIAAFVLAIVTTAAWHGLWAVVFNWWNSEPDGDVIIRFELNQREDPVLDLHRVGLAGMTTFAR